MQIHVQPRRRGGRGCITAVVALVIVLIVGSAVAPIVLSRLMFTSVISSAGDVTGLTHLANSAAKGLGYETAAVEGSDPRHFDPIAAYPQVRAFAGEGVELVSLRATSIRADGTQDLQATYTPQPRTEYQFQRRLAAPPPNAPPVGAGGSVKGEWVEPIAVSVFQPGQMRQITRTGGGSRISTQLINQGMTKETKEAVASAQATSAAPSCPLVLLWQHALTQGAPGDAVATIEYTRDGYHFTIQGTSVNLRFAQNCQPRR